MFKIIPTALIVLFVIAIGLAGYYWGKLGVKPNETVCPNTNVNQNLNANVNITKKVELEKEFTLKKGETASLEGYDIFLELISINSGQSNEFSARIKFTGEEVRNETQTLLNDTAGYYLDLGKFRYLLEKIETDQATLLIQKRFLSESDYYCLPGLNCMPILNGASLRFCEGGYISWATKNCPGFSVDY